MVPGLTELHHLVAFCGEIRFVYGKSRKKNMCSGDVKLLKGLKVHLKTMDRLNIEPQLGNHTSVEGSTPSKHFRGTSVYALSCETINRLR